MKRILVSGIAAAVLAASSFASASATELKVLTSWNKDNWPSYVVLQTFMDKVKEIGKGKVTFSVSGPEVVPPFEQMQPVSAGVFDLLFTHGVYHVGSNGLALVFDGIEPDPKKRRTAGLVGYVDKYYQKHNNVKMLGIVANSNHGYHLFMKQPLDKNGMLTGRKIRGTQSYFGVIKLLGAAPVVMPGGQIYTALEKGVIDGAAWPAGGMLTMKHYEVAKYRMMPTFGTTNEGFFVNMNKWKSLSKEDQDILQKAAIETEIDMPGIGDKILAEENAKLDKLGVKVTTLPPALAAKVKATFAKDMWVIAKKCCGDGSEQLHEMALKAGMTH